MATSEPLDIPVDEQALQERESTVAVDPLIGRVSKGDEIEPSAESFLAELNRLEAEKKTTLVLRPKNATKRKPESSEFADAGKMDDKDEENGNSSGDSVYYSNSSQEEVLYQKQCASIAKRFRDTTGFLTQTGKKRGRKLRQGQSSELQT
jgi:hypothetical protein